MFDDFKELLSIFHAQNVKYLIVGGYAVSLHAQPRATKDIDLLIQPDADNGKALYAALVKFGAPPVLHEFVRLDREIADAFSRGVVDRVRDGRRTTHDADFTDALYAERVDVRVVFIDDDRFQIWDVGVDRDEIVREIRRHDAPGPQIRARYLVQGHADRPDHAADVLAVRRFAV